MKKPLLTVCVITFNHARYIKEAIDNILAQKVNFEWQLVVADDFSTDGTRDILLAYQKKFPERIHLILQKKNVGAEKNWLDLIAYPKTKYLLYMEGDDYFTDVTKLQRQVDFLEAHPKLSMCFHQVKVIYEDGSKGELFPTSEQRANKAVLNIDDLLAFNFIQTNSAMYRWRFIKEDVKDVFPKNVIPGDWVLHLMHAQVGDIGFIDKTMAVYRRHAGGMWWDAHQNKQAFWKKYGMAHLRTYIALLEMFGKDSGRKKILQTSIFNALQICIETGNEKLLDEVIGLYPGLSEAFMVYQQQQLKAARASVAKSDNELSRLKTAVADKDVLIQDMHVELAAIKSSRIWKTRNKVAKALRKKVI